MKKYLVFLLLGATLSGCQHREFNSALQQELCAKVDDEQELRKRYLQSPTENTLLEIQENNKINAKYMRNVLECYGWPGYDLVGKEGSHAAWLLVQHADHDIELQKEACRFLAAAVKSQNALAEDLAYLEDRILINSGKEQRYGTQLENVGNVLKPKPINDAENVDVRRKEYNMQSLEEYITYANECFNKGMLNK